MAIRTRTVTSRNIINVAKEIQAILPMASQKTIIIQHEGKEKLRRLGGVELKADLKAGSFEPVIYVLDDMGLIQVAIRPSYKVRFGQTWFEASIGSSSSFSAKVL